MTNTYDSTRGNVTDRQRRKLWLLEVYRADRDVIVRPATEHTAQWLQSVPLGEGERACRCYRCGTLLTYEALTVDRIKPGCQGGTYRRENIRPSCTDCATKTGNALKAQLR